MRFARRTLSLCLALLLPLLGGCAGLNVEKANVGARADTGFSLHQITVDGQTFPYGVFVPHDYTPAKRWPTILFLHGLFEAGSDGTLQMNNGLGPEIAKRAASFPFIAVFPQSPGWWNTDTRYRAATGALDEVTRQYNTDPDRTYLCGFSAGGFGTWAVGARSRGRFAALATFAALRDDADVPKLTDVPIWSFHNTVDPIVATSNSEAMVQQINAAGGQARLTLYKHFGHECWNPMESGELFDWFLQHPRSPTTAPAKAEPKR